ncbi:MAG: serine/threonine-protein kinase [Deltaproteobacteria bacterium]|nr:serine/threonine-protein kinase [Deltaproteobacteria bacterium]
MVDDPSHPVPAGPSALGSARAPTTVAGDLAQDATVVSSAPTGPPANKLARLGRYTLLERLGVGGMAEVYLAEQVGAAGFQKKVVVKRILPHLAADSQFVQMFAREAKVAARVSHPNVVQIYELAEESGEFFIAMEHIDGLTLHRLAAAAWEQGRAVPIDVVIRTIADAALGLHAAHSLTDEQGRLVHLVHRDVSPDNLMVSKDGVTKVLDFGIAKGELGGPKTKTGNLRGKIPFMPPEQIRGEVLDGRADIYALGVSAYWMLTGERPYDRQSDWHTMQAILNDAPKPAASHNPGVPRALDDLLMRMLQKERDQRPSSGKEVADVLDDLASPSSLGGKKTTVAFLRDVLPSTNSRGNPVSEMKPTVPPKPPVMASSSSPPPPPSPPPFVAGPDTDSDPPRSTLPFTHQDTTTALPTPTPQPPPPYVAPDVDRSVIKPVTLPAAPNAISDILSPPPRSGPPVPLIALGLFAVLALAVAFVVVVMPLISPPLTADAGVVAAPSVIDAGSKAVEVVDAGAVVVVVPPIVPPVVPPIVPPVVVPVVPPIVPVIAGGKIEIRAKGAPTRVRWRAGDVVVGVGSGPLTVPAGTRALIAEDLRRGFTVEVPVLDGEANYGALPTGVVLLVRTNEKTVVTLGDDDVSLQRKLKLVAGRYRFKVVRGDRVKETTIEVQAGKEHVLDAGR